MFSKKEQETLVFIIAIIIIGLVITFIKSKPIKQTILKTTKITKADFLTEININKASNKELQRLPGIGPKLSQRIIEYRKKMGGFITKGDLVKVKGIGKKNFKKMEKFIKLK